MHTRKEKREREIAIKINCTVTTRIRLLRKKGEMQFSLGNNVELKYHTIGEKTKMLKTIIMSRNDINQ